MVIYRIKGTEHEYVIIKPCAMLENAPRSAE